MQKQPKTQRNKWLALSSIPTQMGIVIFLFAYLGQWLDEKYTNSGNWYTKTCTIIGVFLSLYNVIRQVNQINKDE